MYAVPSVKDIYNVFCEDHISLYKRRYFWGSNI